MIRGWNFKQQNAATCNLEVQNVQPGRDFSAAAPEQYRRSAGGQRLQHCGTGIVAPQRHQAELSAPWRQIDDSLILSFVSLYFWDRGYK